MITKIKTADDVKAFAKQLIAERVGFHPDDNFNDYVVFKTEKQVYTKRQAEIRNKLMDECFAICKKEGTDIYAIMLEVTLIETGLNKYIPLPSQEPFEA